MKRKRGAVGGVERLQREERRVDVARDVADVEARALVEDGADLRLGGRRAPEKQFRQPLRPVAHRRAVGLEHVPELGPARRASGPHQQQVRSQLRSHRAGELSLTVEYGAVGRVRGAAVSLLEREDFLYVVLFGDDARKLALEFGDVSAGAAEHRRQQWLLRRRRTRGRERHRDAYDDPSQRHHRLTIGDRVAGLHRMGDSGAMVIQKSEPVISQAHRRLWA